MLSYRLSSHTLRCTLLLASLTLGACSNNTDNSTNTTPAQSFSGVITGPLASMQKWRKEYSDYPIAPSDRLIIGPIVINKTWTTVTLQEPLTTLPYPHELNLLMAKDLYVAGDDFHNRSPGDPDYSEESWIELKRLSDGAILANKDMWPFRGHPQAIDIILIDSQGGETPLPRLVSSGGRIKTLQGEFHLLSYKLFTPDYIPLGSFSYYPQGARYTAIKLRSNVNDVRIEHLLWSIDNYYSGRTWEQAEKRINKQALAREQHERNRVENADQAQ